MFLQYLNAKNRPKTSQEGSGYCQYRQNHDRKARQNSSKTDLYDFNVCKTDRRAVDNFLPKPMIFRITVDKRSFSPYRGPFSVDNRVENVDFSSIPLLYIQSNYSPRFLMFFAKA